MVIGNNTDRVKVKKVHESYEIERHDVLLNECLKADGIVWYHSIIDPPLDSSAPL